MIAFDIDGVIASFGTIFRQYLIDIYNYDVWFDGDSQTFHFEVPGVDDKTMHQHVIEVLKWKADEVPPIPEAIFAVEKIYHKTQQPLYFVTARPKSIAEKSTKDWLEKYIKVPHNVGFASSKNKGRHLQKRGYTTFVEDRLRTANFLATELDKIYLINRVYNMDRLTHPDVIRINSLLEIKP